jgi:hypothetical protein
MRGPGPDPRFAKDSFGLLAGFGGVKQSKTAGTASRHGGYLTTALLL